MTSTWRSSRNHRKAHRPLENAAFFYNGPDARQTLGPEIQLYSSLTQALRKRGKPVKINLLSQGWLGLSASERRFISPLSPYARARRLVWTRQVIINVGKIPVLYARASCLSSNRRPGWLNQLGTRSLGDEVFKRRRGRRQWMTTEVKNNLVELEQYCKNADLGSYMIVRRSELRCQNTKILLSEYFFEKSYEKL